MSGPPSNIESVSLWQALTKMPRPSREIDFPRQTDDGESVGKLRLWVLTQEEILDCEAAAETVVQQKMKQFRVEDATRATLAYRELYENAKAVELISRACRDHRDINVPAFPSSKEIRSRLTSDEISVIALAYSKLQYEIGPIVAMMSKDEMSAWLQRLSEGGSRFPLASLSSAALEELVMYSADRLYPQSTLTTSAGSPPAAGSSSSAESPSAEARVADVLGPVQPTR